LHSDKLFAARFVWAKIKLGRQKHMGGRVFLGVAFTLTMLAQTTQRPTMKITVPGDIAAYGVTLLPATDPNAAQHVTQRAGVDLAAIRGILPYCVALVNNGQSRLLSTTVGFRFTDQQGQPHTFVFSIDDFNADPLTQLKHGDGRLFFPQRGLNVHFALVPSRPMPVGFSDLIQKIETDFAQVQDLEVFIDSVTVEGVGLVGPDLMRNRQRRGNRATTN
jgi:hypothetical protein